MKKKTVAVIGIGMFGLHLIKKLKELGQEVIAIDKDKERASLVGDIADRTFIFDGSDSKALDDSGVDKVETAIVAMGQGNSASLVSTITTTLALKKSGVKNIVVRLDDDTHTDLLMEIGATSLFSPLKMASDKLAHLVIAENYEDYFSINDEYSVLEIEVSEDFEEIGLIELNAPKKYGVIIALVKRDGKHYMPSAQDSIKPRDIIFVFGKKEDANKLAAKLTK